MTTWRVARYGGARIVVQVDEYDPAVAKMVKTLPGPRRWNNDRLTWTLPMIWEVLTGLREIADYCGVTIKVAPKLAAWARAERKRVDSVPDVSSVALEALPRLAEVAPATYAAICSRPFQTVGAKFIATNRSALIADQPGLGKTLQTIAAMIEADVAGPILVVGPKAAVGITWPTEIRRWGTQYDHFAVIGPDTASDERGRKVRQTVEWGNASVFNVGEAAEGKSGFKNRRSWILVGPNYLRTRVVIDKKTGRQKMEKGKKVIEFVNETIPELFDVEWSAIVVDEAHKTLSGAPPKVARQSAQRQGLGMLKLKRGGYRIALTGTPFRGKPEYLWGILNWLRQDLYRAYWPWVERHFDIYADHFSTIIGGIKDETRFYEEAKKVMIRRTKAEVATDLPAKLYGGEPLDPKDFESPVAVWLDMTGAQARQYKQMVKDAVARLKDGTLMANGSLSEMTRLRQLSCSAGQLKDETFYPVPQSNKLDWLAEFLDERGIDDKSDDYTKLPKIVVVSQFTKLLECFAAELYLRGIRSHVYTGKTADKRREAIKHDWQENPDSDKRVLLLNLQSGGTSLTLDAADELVILDEPWNKDDEEQVEDRIHRLSNLHQVTIWRLSSRGSIEEGIARNTTEADRDIKAVLDGERGVEFMLKILGQDA